MKDKYTKEDIQLIHIGCNACPSPISDRISVLELMNKAYKQGYSDRRKDEGNRGKK